VSFKRAVNRASWKGTSVTWLWLSIAKLRERLRSRSNEDGQVSNVTTRIPPVRRPENLATYEGMWVAVVQGVVVAAHPSSHGLALELQRMDHRKRERAVVEYVRPSTDAYIVGVG
jgi:hypothetical protein